MKKGSLNFLGRKNQSLFGTNVEFKDMDKVELVLDSAAIPESGTAKVRSRPTVKHFTSSESVQSFAVPTPKVPVLPPFTEPKINGTGVTSNLPNGRILSVPDLLQGEILIPPPPNSAPPPPPPFSAPPPPSFIPPSPQLFGETDTSLDRASLHPHPMAPPKTPSLTSSDYSADLDLASLKPPPMPPPKPPSETSSFKGSLSNLDVEDIPECPKFTPPPPPMKSSPVLAKAQKTAPPKPVRMSSIPNLDIQSQTPVPPVASNPTPSSFNPQNTAKLYSVQKSTLLVGETEREKKVQSILLLEDSAGNTVGVVNGNSGKNPGSFQPEVAPSKPARRNSSATQLKNDQPDMAQAPSEPPKVEPKISPEPVLAQNIPTEVPAPIKISPKVEKRIPDVRQVVTPVPSPGRPRKYSPILNHRHLNTRGADGSVKKETSTSPLALLMAAKEREKQRTAVSRQNSISTETVSSVIQPSEEKPNSFTVIPRNPTPDSPNAQLKSTTNTQPITSASTKVNLPDVSYSKPELSSTPLRNPTNSSVGVPVTDEEIGEDLVFIPPPPEFANSDTEEEPPVPPPSHPAPAPPLKSAPPPAKTFLADATPAYITSCPPPSHPAPAAPLKAAPPPSKPLPTPILNDPPLSHPAPPPAKPSLPPIPPPVTNGPLTLPKPKPPSFPPKAPGPPPTIQPQSKPSVQTKPTQPPAQVAPSVSTSQATLLSILQKKMLEMDPKFSAVKEVEINGDDWNSPLSDDEATSPPATYNPMTNLSFTLPTQTRGVDMRELESKAAKKAQNLATSAKSQNSNGPSTKQQFGMTFTVRPGAKQPITPVIKDSSS